MNGTTVETGAEPFALDVQVVVDVLPGDVTRGCNTDDGCATTCASSCASRG